MVVEHCSVALQDKVMVTGGMRYNQPGSDVAEMMNINSGDWEVLSKMNYPRADHTCTTVWLSQHSYNDDILNGGYLTNTSVLSVVVAGGKY